MGVVGSVDVRWGRAGILVAAVPALVWWIERIAAIPRAGWFAGGTTFPVGGDFRTFHTAALLAVDGRAGMVYDPSTFLTALGDGAVSYGPLGSPPPLMLFLAPLGWLSFEGAWLVWSLLSLVGIALALWAMGVRRWMLVGLGTLLFPPVYYTITFGQLGGALWLLIVAVAYRLLKSSALVPAGAVAGLLIAKPTLALGLALWWLVEWKRYWRAAVAAVVSALGALAVSYLVFPDMWTGYGESLGTFVSLRETAATQWAQFSLWSFWELLVPGTKIVATGLGIASTVAFAGAAVWMLRRVATLEQKLSVAVLATLLVPPHLLAYDWILLLVPGVMLWNRTPRSVPVASAVALTTAVSIMLTNNQLDTGGSAFQLAPVVLLAAIVIDAEALGLRNAPAQVHQAAAPVPSPSHLPSASWDVCQKTCAS